MNRSPGQTPAVFSRHARGGPKLHGVLVPDEMRCMMSACHGVEGRATYLRRARCGTSKPRTGCSSSFRYSETSVAYVVSTISPLPQLPGVVGLAPAMMLQHTDPGRVEVPTWVSGLSTAAHGLPTLRSLRATRRSGLPTGQHRRGDQCRHTYGQTARQRECMPRFALHAAPVAA